MSYRIKDLMYMYSVRHLLCLVLLRIILISSQKQKKINRKVLLLEINTCQFSSLTNERKNFTYFKNESTMSPNSTIFKGQLLTTVSFLAKQITLVGPGSVWNIFGNHCDSQKMAKKMSIREYFFIYFLTWDVVNNKAKLFWHVINCPGNSYTRKKCSRLNVITSCPSMNSDSSVSQLIISL